MSVVCRTCLDVIGKDSQRQYYSLNDEADLLAMKITSKLKDCFPEFTVDVVKNSIICNNCIDALYVVYKFQKKIMETEEKISKYIMEGNIKNDKPIDINLVLAWLPKYEAYKRGKPLSETVVTSNIYDSYLKHFDANVESDTNIRSEPNDETDTSSAADDSAFGKLLEIDWNYKNLPKSPDNLNCSPTSHVYKCEEGVLSELLGAHDSKMDKSSDQFDWKEKLVDLSDNYYVTDILIGTEAAEEPPSAIVSGMTYDYDYFDEFEKQFAGYTMDELYANQLIAMPECSVVVDRLTNEEIKRWTKQKRENFVQHMNNRVHKKKKYLSRKKPHITECKQKYHECVLCKYRTKFKRNFSSHMFTHEKSLTDGTKCYMCGYVLSNMEDMRDHFKSYHSKTLIKCTLCPFATDNHILFKDHLKLHLSNYKCVECSYATIYKKYLIKHYLRRHFHVAPFICIKCNLNFSSRFKLVKHMLNYKNIQGIYAEHNYATKR